MQRTFGLAVLATCGVEVLLLILCAVVSDTAGLRGALVGAVLALLLAVLTLLVVRVGRRVSPVGMAAVVLGGWAAKIAIVLVALIVVSRFDGIDLLWVAITLLSGAAVALALETVLLSGIRNAVDVTSAGLPQEAGDGEERP